MADTKEIINCPACGCEMKKVLIEQTGINVDICVDGCGGILFDNRELEKFDETHENADAIFEQIKDKTFKKVDESEIRVCPVCGTNMTKMGAADGDIQIDVCNFCGAKFLDKNELSCIRKFSEKEYEENELTEKIIDNLTEKENYNATLGEIGYFLNKYVPSTGGRKKSEDIIKKFLK